MKTIDKLPDADMRHESVRRLLEEHIEDAVPRPGPDGEPA
jgi:hypothetical protein